MRKYLIFFIVVGFVGFFLQAVVQKEALRRNGTKLILALVPVDPRSLMQGDYMILRCDLGNVVEEALRRQTVEAGRPAPPRRGAVLVRPNAKGVAEFVAVDDKSPPPAGTQRLSYVFRNGEISFGADSFFFQEGHAPAYTKARFVLLRVAVDGTSLTEALLDEEMQPIRP